DMVDENIPHLLPIAQGSLHFHELHMNAHLDFACVLSSNVQLDILFSSQLQILYFTSKEVNCSYY
ncbi:unnamed protein product, partial [Rotaria sordida]